MYLPNVSSSHPTLADWRASRSARLVWSETAAKLFLPDGHAVLYCTEMREGSCFLKAEKKKDPTLCKSWEVFIDNKWRKVPKLSIKRLGGHDTPMPRKKAKKTKTAQSKANPVTRGT